MKNFYRSPFRLRTLLNAALLLLAGGALLVYAAVEAHAYLAGITIAVRTPENGATVREPLITVAGEIANAAFITLNGRELLTDEGGQFEESILVSPGYNLFTVAAEDKFGRMKEKKLEIIYRP
ncbi:MAG: hypothetical protein Q8R39_04180 [bacterium]|nr:hypothetical protein [bacterium]MDZ4284490.1 hypothetical protein [Patescibacteria group bacterium]